MLLTLVECVKCRGEDETIKNVLRLLAVSNPQLRRLLSMPKHKALIRHAKGPFIAKNNFCACLLFFVNKKTIVMYVHASCYKLTSINS